MNPDGRLSRPTRISPGCVSAAKAIAYRAATSGVSVSPTIPRSPETVMIGSVKVGFGDSGLGEQFSRRVYAALAGVMLQLDAAQPRPTLLVSSSKKRCGMLILLGR